MTIISLYYHYQFNIFAAYMTELPLSKAPNPQLLPGRRSINGCPLLQCVFTVCVCSLLCVCTLDGLNAEHEFRVWVTILGHTSLHFILHISDLRLSWYIFIYIFMFLLSSSSVHIHFNRLDGFSHLQKVSKKWKSPPGLGLSWGLTDDDRCFIFVCVNLKESDIQKAGSNSSLLFAV